jgi:hypothetical protein
MYPSPMQKSPDFFNRPLASDLKDLKDLKGDDWLSFFEEKASPPLERRRMLNLILTFKPNRPLKISS